MTGPATPLDTRRSPLVRILLRVVHQHQRQRRIHPVRRWVLTWAGRNPDRLDRTAACRQCDRTDFVAVLRLGRRRVRYWCGHCGAVVAGTDLATLLPARARRRATPAPPAASAPASEPDQVAGRVMPAAMYRWAARQSRRPLTLAALDRPLLYQLYKRWDAHLSQCDPATQEELAVAGEPVPVAGLPPISAVIGALHDLCYRTELVVASLTDGKTPDPQTFAAVWERAEHARQWLAGRVAEQCWIVTRLVDGQPVRPDPAQVQAAVTALQAGEIPDPAAGRAARAALFGTDGGPSLRTLQRVYSTDQLCTALTGHLRNSDYPLRAEVLAYLTAPLRPAPLTSVGKEKADR